MTTLYFFFNNFMPSMGRDSREQTGKRWVEIGDRGAAKDL